MSKLETNFSNQRQWYHEVTQEGLIPRAPHESTIHVRALEKDAEWERLSDEPQGIVGGKVEQFI